MAPFYFGSMDSHSLHMGAKMRLKLDSANAVIALRTNQECGLLIMDCSFVAASHVSVGCLDLYSIQK